MIRTLLLLTAAIAFVLPGCSKETAEEALARMGGVHVVLDVDDSNLTADDREEAIARVAEIIRERLTQFGITKPMVYREGEKRIIVRLPGHLDAQRAERLIGKTAQLEFRLVSDTDEVARVLRDLDQALKGVEVPLRAFSEDAPFTSYLLSTYGAAIVVDERNKEAVDLLLATLQAQTVVPRRSAFLWEMGSRPTQDGGVGRMLYLTEKAPVLTGSKLTDARTRRDPDDPSRLNVMFQLDREGTEIFSRFTGDNIGRRIAIVLDNMISSAPVIQTRIPGGKGRITGSFTDEEAEDLAIILRSGVFPAPVRIIETRLLPPEG